MRSPLAAAAVAVLLLSSLRADASADPSLRSEIDAPRGLAASGVWNGEPGAPAASLHTFRQLAFELSGRGGAASAWPEDRALRDAGRARADGVIPIGLIHASVEPRGAGARSRVFAMAPLRDRTRRGARVTFEIAPEHVLADAPEAVRSLAADFDDGAGYRTLGFGQRVEIAYPAAGKKTLRMRAVLDDGSVLHAASPFDVLGLSAPAPHDTIAITATIPYQSVAGSGAAYVYLGAGHAAIENPVIVVEGFDIDDTIGWDELYELLNRESLLESLRAEGFDAVVLDFTSATDHIQRNAYVVVELIQQVRALIDPGTQMVVAGASMGGLVARYALAYMEQNALPHGVRTFISFDAPQRGANIPLGVQQWVDFFASQSAEAAFLRDRLNSPAARQMLVYHHATPPASTGQPDPLRAVLTADLAALGDYPDLPRNVAIANGSGNGVGQGFAPGAQLVAWNHDTFALDLIGNVWAVPDGGSGQILQGRIFVLFIVNQTRNVTVSGTEPYDNAPGGFRTTMADMDSVPAPGGDIVALHPAHSFIPTVSALDITTSGLFLDLTAVPDPLALTPFDAIRFPSANQEHVRIDAQNAEWIREEVESQPVAVEPPARAKPALSFRLAPNPSSASVRLRFVLPSGGEAELGIFSVDGREVARLVREERGAGPHEIFWDGRDGSGRRTPPGLYFARLVTAFGRSTLRLVRVE